MAKRGGKIVGCGHVVNEMAAVRSGALELKRDEGTDKDKEIKCFVRLTAVAKSGACELRRVQGTGKEKEIKCCVV